VYLFRYRSDFSKATENTSGAKLKDGTWTGVLGMLVRGEAQVGDNAFTMTSEIVPVVDFTCPVVKIRCCIHFT
jgi:hypothetical protein